ncbi:hypothetical protein B0T22DRAFT_516098 [Podospora appendiculata]|uniref:F-box domain-containing protein n=1 Tax=Podospora appendiculata TaxID=314037 RepID=A0AAE1CEK6_9PEZI|nr:hypothetical protein B0T22DRAFT_516098 [Podospora appendiculata]
MGAYSGRSVLGCDNTATLNTRYCISIKVGEEPRQHPPVIRRHIVFTIVGLLSLPTEILLQANRIDNLNLLHDLSLVCRRFYNIFNPLIYDHVILRRYPDHEHNTAYRRKHNGDYDPDYFFSADKLVLLLQTPVESPRHREMIREIDCRIYLRELPPHHRLKEGWPCQGDDEDDEAAKSTYSWARNARNIHVGRPGSPENYGRAVLEHVGLASLAVRCVREGFCEGSLPEDLGDRIFVAIRCLATSLQSLIIQCPICCHDGETQLEEARVRYTTLDSLITSALDLPVLRDATPPVVVRLPFATDMRRYGSWKVAQPRDAQYTIIEDLIASALSDPRFRNSLLPALTKLTMADEPYVIPRKLRRTQQRMIPIAPDICRGLLLAPKVDTVEVALDTYSLAGWGSLTSASNRIIRAVIGMVGSGAGYPRTGWGQNSRQDWDALAVICGGWPALKELVMDVSCFSTTEAGDIDRCVKHHRLDEAFVYLVDNDTLERLDMAVGIFPTWDCDYNPLDDMEEDTPRPPWIRSLPMMGNLKHLRVTLEMLLGNDIQRTPQLGLALPPNLVTLCLVDCPTKTRFGNAIVGGEIDPAFQDATHRRSLATSNTTSLENSSFSWPPDMTELPLPVEAFASFAMTCGVTHPQLREIVYEDSGRMAFTAYLGGVPFLHRCMYQPHNMLVRVEWAPRLRDLFAESGVKFDWVRVGSDPRVLPPKSVRVVNPIHYS